MDSKRCVGASDFIPQSSTDGDKIERDAAELPNQIYLQDVRYVDAADILMAAGILLRYTSHNALKNYFLAMWRFI